MSAVDLQSHSQYLQAAATLRISLETNFWKFMSCLRVIL